MSVPLAGCGRISLKRRRPSPLRVSSGSRTLPCSRPLLPSRRTSTKPSAMSAKGHDRTHAPQQQDGQGLSYPMRCAHWGKHAGDNRDARKVAYFDFFGTRFFGPDLPDGSASSPWQGQASLKASKERVMPGSLNRSGLLSRYRNRTLALSRVLPSGGGHARISGG